tara:strand:- start:356 stop:670 length:315 start_codon:yes stop_codon:yes gene_type:complete
MSKATARHLLRRDALSGGYYMACGMRLGQGTYGEQFTLVKRRVTCSRCKATKLFQKPGTYNRPEKPREMCPKGPFVDCNCTYPFCSRLGRDLGKERILIPPTDL